ncbi:MAG: DNA repair protein RadC [Clostridium sp.]|uniref:RadC family protein n=1 Tax=Clostridium sp. TaxID=1506 RepID=UPI002FC99ADF
MNNPLKIKDIPMEDRPRERLLSYGPEVLSNSELLAVILRCGNKNQSAIDLAGSILSYGEGLSYLQSCSIDELSQIKGIGSAKASMIKASIELGKRIRNLKQTEKITITSPKDAAMVLFDDMKWLKKEHLKVALLNTKNHLIKVCDVSIGTLNSSIVHPREVFYEAIKNTANAIIIYHNHPSGDPSPSREDINITTRLKDAGKIMGIEVLDHIIIAGSEYLSFKEKGLL